ncbi:MAG: polymer-forming cytoskeletal protein [Porphyromonadaceae bacterium]|jgi:cytoskeletal protein CcmA (bactofilin family)|nr:polymer-forming cytoskeletal protein [Porphyromonadaceae bacterium]
MAKDFIPNQSIVNIIAAGTKIVGKVTVESDFRLDGEVEGDIIGRSKVVIGEKGNLQGSLTCTDAEIIGTVKGNIVTSNSLTLRSTAELIGDVKIKTLIVEPNAVFNGSCSMREEVKPTVKTSKEV